MSIVVLSKLVEHEVSFKTMQDFGENFIENLPKHFENLKITDQCLDQKNKIKSLPSQIDNINDIQNLRIDVLNNPITIHAQNTAEKTFQAFLNKQKTDVGMLKFLNGCNETHKTTSQVSAKIIMRLVADAILIDARELKNYLKTMCNIYEVAKDDFGLIHTFDLNRLKKVMLDYNYRVSLAFSALHKALIT